MRGRTISETNKTFIIKKQTYQRLQSKSRKALSMLHQQQNFKPYELDWIFPTMNFKYTLIFINSLFGFIAQ